MLATIRCTRRKADGMNEDDEYLEGYPKRRGWYDCVVGGKETRLHYYHCDMRGADVWEDDRGRQVHRPVKWRRP